MSQPYDQINDVCLVCGVAGYPEHLISCSSCKFTKEHRYCMKALCLSKEAECSWVCQECIRFDEDLDKVPISAIFRLKKEFTKVQKDASSTDFDDKSCFQVHELKESHPQVVEKASFQEEMRLLTIDQEESMNEHDLTILQEELDATLMISGSLSKSDADGKRKRKVVVSDSSDDELTTNVQPELINYLNTESGGSFSLWLDDASKDAVAINNCDSFSFDAKVVTHEGNSCEDVYGVSMLSLGNNNVALCDNALVNVNEDGDEKTAIGRRASYNACNDASVVKSREGRDVFHHSNKRTHGNDVRENSSLVNGDVALINSNELVNVNRNVRENIYVAKRALDDACGGASLAEPDRHNSRASRDDRTNGKDREKVSLVRDDILLGNVSGIRCEKKNSLVKRASDDTCGGKSVFKPKSNDDTCGGKSLVKPKSDCDNGFISHDGTNGNAAKYHMLEEFDLAANYAGREDVASPVETITWRGYFSLGHSNYGIMHAHLTTTSYNDGHVNEEVKKMNGVLSLEEVPNRIAWPSTFYSSSSPSQKDIHLYFFAKNMGSEGETDYWYDELVRQLHERDISYRAILDCSELLLLPSILLPEYYQKFFGRRYLWGLFRPKQTDYPKPTNRGIPSYNRSNEYPVRTDSSSHPLKRNATSVTHDTTRQRKRASGVFPNRRADEGRDSLKMISAGGLSDNYVVDRHVKSGSDSSAAHCDGRFNYKDKSVLKVIPLQVGNIAVVSKLDQHSILNLEFKI